MSECPLICLQTAGNSAGTDDNQCDATTLTYDCICSNGIAPNVSEYSQTLPYFNTTASARRIAVKTTHVLLRASKSTRVVHRTRRG
jgi:hypothetical protein